MAGFAKISILQQTVPVQEVPNRPRPALLDEPPVQSRSKPTRNPSRQAPRFASAIFRP